MVLILCRICLRWAIAIFRTCAAKPVTRFRLLNVFDARFATCARDLSVGTRSAACFYLLVLDDGLLPCASSLLIRAAPPELCSVVDIAFGEAFTFPTLGYGPHFSEREPFSVRALGAQTPFGHVGGHRSPLMAQSAFPRHGRARVYVSPRNASPASPLGESPHLGKSRLAHGTNDHVAPARTRRRAAPREKIVCSRGVPTVYIVRSGTRVRSSQFAESQSVCR